jgi:hypothetical protein
MRRVDDEVNGQHGRPTHPAFDDEHVQKLIDTYLSGPVEHRRLPSLLDQINVHVHGPNVWLGARTRRSCRVNVGARVCVQK